MKSFSVKGFMRGQSLVPRNIKAQTPKAAAEKYANRPVRLLKEVTDFLHVFVARGFTGIFVERQDKPHQMKSNPRKPETGIRSYGPGKFHTLIDLYIYHLDTDEELGDVQDFGWYGILRDLERSEVEEIAREEFNDSLTVEEQGLLDDTVGAIVSEDSQGFYNVELFDNSDKLEADWEALRDEADLFYDENEGY